jgi:hypothetical protein
VRDTGIIVNDLMMQTLRSAGSVSANNHYPHRPFRRWPAALTPID